MSFQQDAFQNDAFQVAAGGGGTSVTATMSGFVAAAVLGGVLVTGGASSVPSGFVQQATIGGTRVTGDSYASSGGLVQPATLGGVNVNTSATVDVTTPVGGFAQQATFGGGQVSGGSVASIGGFAATVTLGGQFVRGDGSTTVAGFAPQQILGGVNVSTFAAVDSTSPVSGFVQVATLGGVSVLTTEGPVIVQQIGGMILRRRYEDMVREYMSRRQKPRAVSQNPKSAPKKTQNLSISSHPYSANAHQETAQTRISLKAIRSEVGSRKARISSVSNSVRLSMVHKADDEPKTSINLSSVDLDLELLVGLLMEIG